MKRKWATYPDWQKVIARRFAVTSAAEPPFDGQVALLTFDAIGEQGWLAIDGRRLLIADDGYCWLQYFPRGARHIITATFDERNRFVYWYIDIAKEHGLDVDGVPWYDDLYLDVVVLPDGARQVLDADELDEALAEGKITPEEWRLAWEETSHVLTLLAAGLLTSIAFAVAHLAHLRALPMRTLAPGSARA